MGAAFAGRAGLQQRVLPVYRRAFFELLGRTCEGGLSVFAGKPRPGEAIRSAEILEGAELVRGRNLHLLSGAGYLCYQIGLREWLERWSPDVLILEANPRYLSSGAAVRWMHRRGRPVIGWGLGVPQANGLLRGLRRRLRRRFILQFDALLTYSEQGAAEYISLGASPERTFVAANAVSPRPGPAPVRDPLGGRPGRILYVGRLQARKRVDLLFEACSRLPEEPELRIVGDGPDRPRLEALAADLCPQARFAGALFGEELQASFAWADVFVLPGTGGLAVQEAMANGLAVIVARGDGTQRDLVADENGWLLPADNLESLTAALKEAFADPERLLAMGARSHRLAVERFNIESMAETFVQAMNNVVGT
ncbi:MAG: glycosyltransferase family 4 protein [Anaerolineales bacterium]